MPKFINRDIRIFAGPLLIEARTETGAAKPMLKVRFNITKTNDSKPNTCKLDIWNLQKDSRSKLEGKDIEVIIEAGYVDEIATIFKGDLDFVSTAKETVDWLTSLDIGDGTKQMRKSRINESFVKGTSAGEALKKVAEAIGLDVGNIKDKIASDGNRSLLKQFVSGTVFSGNTAKVIDDLAADLGYRFSVQDKKIQLLPKGGTLPDPPVPLNERNGLIQSPERGEDGIVIATSLLNGKIRPGQRVRLDSVVISGEFRTEKVTHTGDSWGQDWTTEAELKRL